MSPCLELSTDGITLLSPVEFFPSPCPVFNNSIPHLVLFNWDDLFPYPEFPSNPHEVSQEPQQTFAIIGGAICGTVLLAAITLLVVFLYRRRGMFKGDYSTNNQIIGNGYSKAGNVPSHPSLPHSRTFSEDSDEEKKLDIYRGSSLLGRSVQEFHNCHDTGMKAYHMGLIEDHERCGHSEQTYIYDYGSEVEVSVDMIPQMDGSVISKKEWYV